MESNTEHWNALLLSLRELIEWVIRKDTELTGLGPVCGDVAALQKQEASFDLTYKTPTFIFKTIFKTKLSIYPYHPTIIPLISSFPNRRFPHRRIESIELVIHEFAKPS